MINIAMYMTFHFSCSVSINLIHWTFKVRLNNLLSRKGMIHKHYFIISPCSFFLLSFSCDLIIISAEVLKMKSDQKQIYNL